jgi:hypothetical protein
VRVLPLDVELELAAVVAVDTGVTARSGLVR